MAWHDDKQKYTPNYGYSSPTGKCKNSSFASGSHRVGIFKVGEVDNFIRIQNKCVNCGKNIGKTRLMLPEKKVEV